MNTPLITLLATALCTTPAVAELAASAPEGFTTRHVQEFPAPPATLYRVMVEEVAHWWEADHTWSGKAENLYIDARIGGCFCERLPDGGFAEHLRLVYLAPGREVRFQGALGPLQQMGAQGTMSWVIEATEGGSRLTWTYTVHGWTEDGFGAIAPAVDFVNGAQVAGIVRRVGSG